MGTSLPQMWHRPIDMGRTIAPAHPVRERHLWIRTSIATNGHPRDDQSLLCLEWEFFVEVLTPEAPADGLPARAAHRRRRWVVAAIGVVAASLVVAAAGWDATYMPLNADGEMAPAVQRNLAQISDGVVDTQWVITGPTGSQASVAYLLNNTGPVGITVNGLAGSHIAGYVGEATSPHSAVLMSLAWTPTVHGSFPVPMPQHRFPAHIPAGGSIALDVTVTKPACTPGVDPAITDVPISWSALGLSHRYDMTLQLGGNYLPIDACPTAKSLQRITSRTP